jgi:hypothetical protein
MLGSNIYCLCTVYSSHHFKLNPKFRRWKLVCDLEFSFAENLSQGDNAGEDLPLRRLFTKS